MDLTLLKDFNKSVWYRGNKVLKTIDCAENIVKFSNNDVIQQKGRETYINDNLMSNIPDLTLEELMFIYYEYLKAKGYKFLGV